MKFEIKIIFTVEHLDLGKVRASKLISDHLEHSGILTNGGESELHPTIAIWVSKMQHWMYQVTKTYGCSGLNPIVYIKSPRYDKYIWTSTKRTDFQGLFSKGTPCRKAMFSGYHYAR